jgi:hypothetical protein
MSHRRLAAAVFFSAVIVVVLALIVYTERTNATETVSVWIVTHDVTAGTAFDTSDVQLIQVRAESGDFNFEQLGPAAFPARFARSLSANDLLRSDDLIANTAQSEVALTVENPPPLVAGEDIDIFAAVPDDQQVLVGHDLVVSTVSGGALTVLVPVGDEASWIAVGSSNVALHVALTVSGAQIAPSPLSASSAIHILCGTACADLPDPVDVTPGP